MSLTTPKAAFQLLKRHVARMNKWFIVPHAGSLKLGSNEQLDLDAYVVLCHAELEYYFEELAKWLLDTMVHRWRMQSKASGGLVALALRYNATAVDWSVESTHFERVRTFLEDKAKKDHSHLIDNNHGTGLDYLLKMLAPLGIDIPRDANWRNSLDILVRVRGERAHKGRLGATILKSPTDLSIIVADCVKLAEKVRDLVLAVAN